MRWLPRRICWAATLLRVVNQTKQSACLRKVLDRLPHPPATTSENGNRTPEFGIAAARRISLATLWGNLFSSSYGAIPLAAAVLYPRRVTGLALNSRRLPNAPPIIVNRRLKCP